MTKFTSPHASVPATKTCVKCKREKSITAFHKNTRNKDGHDGRCKECRRALDRVHYLTRYDDYYAYRRSDAYKKSTQASVATYRKKHPLRSRAWSAVHKAVKNGTLEKLPCEACGDPNAHAHHDDYSKPLDVVWLCQPHHAARHQVVQVEG